MTPVDGYRLKRRLVRPLTAVRRWRAGDLNPYTRGLYEAHDCRPSMRRFLEATRAKPDLLVDVSLPAAWHKRAACRGQGVNLFFPASGASLAPARAVCSGCAVFDQCQAAGLADATLQGVWGGLSDRDRVRLRRGAA